MKFSEALLSAVLHMLTKNQAASHYASAANDIRLTSCFADFDQQQGFTTWGEQSLAIVADPAREDLASDRLKYIR